MNLTHRLTTFFLFMLSIIGICGVQEHENATGLANLIAQLMKDEKACPTDKECSDLPGHCYNCDINETCVYGKTYNVTCTAKPACSGATTVEKTMICRFCYQTEHWEHTCIQKASCDSVASPKAYYRTNCSVKDNIICLGQRKFYKKLPCNWTGGYRWSTALALSITLGGFGADRFYLGHWQEGIGKLFSFGGLGVWTLIDVILIALHYLGPADGSLYL
ncbi:TM2 domain-containing protein almondex-like [Thrips palmi]|uniref:TM2 domain-containing protein almondex-like n=1 Tax=Thrips palmi TaxID=161013 RepID=A0A6P8YVI7_THRPL|nr:TM2 domain-containing protein almondex-like [Thrips palmi]